MQSEGGIVLQTMDIQLKKGLNYPTYNLYVLSAVKEEYLNEIEKAEKKKVKFAESEKGQVFLYKGKYTISVKTENSEEKQTLIIK